MLKDRPIWVAVPTIGYSPLLIPLVNELERDRAVDKIILTVNLEKYVEPVKDFFRFGEPSIEVVETWTRGKSLHHGWNTAIELARKENAWLAVLNDDIRLLESDAISGIVELLSDNSDYAVIGLNWQEGPEETPDDSRPLRQVHGTYRNHGVGGFAWVCDPHKIVTVPPDFQWWYGDDHIMWSAERDGHKIGIANHLHVEHVNELTSSSGEHGWTYEVRALDAKAFQRIWPGK